MTRGLKITQGEKTRLITATVREMSRCRKAGETKRLLDVYLEQCKAIPGCSTGGAWLFYHLIPKAMIKAIIGNFLDNVLKEVRDAFTKEPKNEQNLSTFADRLIDQITTLLEAYQEATRTFAKDPSSGTTLQEQRKSAIASLNKSKTMDDLCKKLSETIFNHFFPSTRTFIAPNIEHQLSQRIPFLGSAVEMIAKVGRGLIKGIVIYNLKKYILPPILRISIDGAIEMTSPKNANFTFPVTQGLTSVLRSALEALLVPSSITPSDTKVVFNKKRAIDLANRFLDHIELMGKDPTDPLRTKEALLAKLNDIDHPKDYLPTHQIIRKTVQDQIVGGVETVLTVFARNPNKIEEILGSAVASLASAFEEVPPVATQEQSERAKADLDQAAEALFKQIVHNTARNLIKGANPKDCQPIFSDLFTKEQTAALAFLQQIHNKIKDMQNKKSEECLLKDLDFCRQALQEMIRHTQQLRIDAYPDGPIKTVFYQTFAPLYQAEEELVQLLEKLQQQQLEKIQHEKLIEMAQDFQTKTHSFLEKEFSRKSLRKLIAELKQAHATLTTELLPHDAPENKQLQNLIEQLQRLETSHRKDYEEARTKLQLLNTQDQPSLQQEARTSLQKTWRECIERMKDKERQCKELLTSHQQAMEQIRTGYKQRTTQNEQETTQLLEHFQQKTKSTYQQIETLEEPNLTSLMTPIRTMASDLLLNGIAQKVTDPLVVQGELMPIYRGAYQWITSQDTYDAMTRIGLYLLSQAYDKDY